MYLPIGGEKPPEKEDLSENLLQVVAQNGNGGGLFSWGDYWLAPLFDREESGELLGLLGAARQADHTLDPEQADAFHILTERAALALSDHHRQQQVFSSLEALTPQMDMIQSLRAAARFDGAEVLTRPGVPVRDRKLSQWVKEALAHYWGGPKLTQSPLLELKVVRKATEQGEDSPANALRAVLRRAIEQVRPEGERRFTAEWILFNILEMKFMEGRKVREIAMRLAMSEADLYRKQRVAVEAVAAAIVEMEQQAIEEETPAESAAIPAASPTKRYEDTKGGLNGK
jgi:hypothetical protein